MFYTEPFQIKFINSIWYHTENEKWGTKKQKRQETERAELQKGERIGLDRRGEKTGTEL